ncbi:MAG: type II toxin-antitoxin system ParD family antitoxin [Chloroflexi bacterium]|nr:type II toxin-antitoxin system ParD family antitoxin [Chloroflexota bacterium]
MNKPLTPNEREELIKRKVSSGVYESRDDVIDAALRLLDERDKHLEDLRAKVRMGIKQIENGDFVEYTDENLHELFEEIESEGLRELEKRRNDAG